MNIESKLSINNIKRNKNRDFYTCISIVFCSMLIFMFLLVSLSIKNGINETINSEYNDFHFIVNDITQDDLEKVKNAGYEATTPIVITNMEKVKILEKTESRNVTKGEKLVSYKCA